MSNEIEKREAGDKTKGFRLQKLRATKLALQEIQKNSEVYIYFSVELFGDVFLYTDDFEKVKELSEENKNYNQKMVFTFNSEQIRNTLVIFLQVWYIKRFSRKIRFSFYTTANIGKEYKAGILKDIKIPKEGILNNLHNKKYNDEDTLEISKQLLLNELTNQGLNNEADIFKQLPDDQWISFFDLIIWNFNQVDDAILENEITDLIKICPYYKYDYHAGFEKFIKSYIIDELDSIQNRTDYYERVLTTADIELIFLKAERGYLKGCDPSHIYFEEIEVTDRRNIIEKVLSVCTDYSSAKKNTLARKVLLSKTEQNSNKGDKSLLAQICRIYDACDNFLSNQTIYNATPDEIDSILVNLLDKSFSSLEELSKTYKYPLLNKESIKNMIFDLFDRCYLNFNSQIDIRQE